MIQILAQASLQSTTAAPLPSTRDIVARVKTGSERLMGRHGALLCLIAQTLMEEASLTSPVGPDVGTYCVLGVQNEDPAAIAVLRHPHPTLAQAFASEIAPTQSLKELPSVLAFWPTAVTGAQGPCDFPESEVSAEQARRQAELDLADGVCRIAFVLSVTSEPESGTGMILRWDAGRSS